MPRYGTSLLVLVSVLCTALPAVAQEPMRLEAGEQIRFRLADRSTVQGRLIVPVRMSTQELVFCEAEVPVCPGLDSAYVHRRRLSDAVGLEVRRGDRAAGGAAIGAGVTLVAVLVYSLRWADADASAPFTTSEWLVGTAGLTALGAGVGGLIGSRSGQWERVR